MAHVKGHDLGTSTTWVPVRMLRPIIFFKVNSKVCLQSGHSKVPCKNNLSVLPLGVACVIKSFMWHCGEDMSASWRSILF